MRFTAEEMNIQIQKQPETVLADEAEVSATPENNIQQASSTEELELPFYDRETEILYDVLDAMKIKDIKFDFDEDSIIAIGKNHKWYGTEFYHFLIGEVLVFEDDGKVLGMSNKLFSDFEALCEHNGIEFEAAPIMGFSM